jgi:ubiquitin C-terminal hydrolase
MGTESKYQLAGNIILGQVKHIKVTFKKEMCKLATQFQGFEQNDSFEFLTYILNGLHEELKSEMAQENLKHFELFIETPSEDREKKFEVIN